LEYAVHLGNLTDNLRIEVKDSAVVLTKLLNSEILSKFAPSFLRRDENAGKEIWHATVGTVHGVMMEMNDKQYKLNDYHTFLPDDFFNFAPRFIEIINKIHRNHKQDSSKS